MNAKSKHWPNYSPATPWALMIARSINSSSRSKIPRTQRGGFDFKADPGPFRLPVKYRILTNATHGSKTTILILDTKRISNNNKVVRNDNVLANEGKYHQRQLWTWKLYVRLGSPILILLKTRRDQSIVRSTSLLFTRTAGSLAFLVGSRSSSLNVSQTLGIGAWYNMHRNRLWSISYEKCLKCLDKYLPPNYQPHSQEFVTAMTRVSRLIPNSKWSPWALNAFRLARNLNRSVFMSHWWWKCIIQIIENQNSYLSLGKTKSTLYETRKLQPQAKKILSAIMHGLVTNPPLGGKRPLPTRLSLFRATSITSAKARSWPQNAYAGKLRKTQFRSRVQSHDFRRGTSRARMRKRGWRIFTCMLQ